MFLGVSKSLVYWKDKLCILVRIQNPNVAENLSADTDQKEMFHVVVTPPCFTMLTEIKENF